MTSNASASKLEIARRQLGKALWFYLHDQDPASVHCLACEGAELAEQLAIEAGSPPFRKFALSSCPMMPDRDLMTLRNQYSNAFKRDDEKLLIDFCERENGARLFIGWLDYGTATRSLPVETQVFNGWFLASGSSRFVTPEGIEFMARLNKEFPGLAALSMERRKQRLRRSIEKWSRDRKLRYSEHTDRRPLVLP